jgi:hypothetical protein
MTLPQTPDEGHEFYVRPENQEPVGPARRRRPRLGSPVPVERESDREAG